MIVTVLASGSRQILSVAELGLAAVPDSVSFDAKPRVCVNLVQHTAIFNAAPAEPETQAISAFIQEFESSTLWQSNAMEGMRVGQQRQAAGARQGSTYEQRAAQRQEQERVARREAIGRTLGESKVVEILRGLAEGQAE